MGQIRSVGPLGIRSDSVVQGSIPRMRRGGAAAAGKGAASVHRGGGAAYTMVRPGQRHGRARLGEGAGLNSSVL